MRNFITLLFLVILSVPGSAGDAGSPVVSIEFFAGKRLNNVKIFEEVKYNPADWVKRDALKDGVKLFSQINTNYILMADCFQAVCDPAGVGSGFQSTVSFVDNTVYRLSVPNHSLEISPLRNVDLEKIAEYRELDYIGHAISPTQGLNLLNTKLNVDLKSQKFSIEDNSGENRLILEGVLTFDSKTKKPDGFRVVKITRWLPDNCKNIVEYAFSNENQFGRAFLPSAVTVMDVDSNGKVDGSNSRSYSYKFINDEGISPKALIPKGFGKVVVLDRRFTPGFSYPVLNKIIGLKAVEQLRSHPELFNQYKISLEHTAK